MPKPRTTHTEDRTNAYIKALAHPTRVAILQEISAENYTSPSAIAAAWSSYSAGTLPDSEQPIASSALLAATGSYVTPALGTVSYHVRELVKLGVIQLNRMEPRRGAMEHFYKLAPDFAEHLKRTRDLLDTLA